MQHKTFIFLALMLLTACQKSTLIRQGSVDFSAYESKKVFIIEESGSYTLYVRLSSMSVPSSVMRSIYPVYLARLSNNEGHVVYVSEEQGNPSIFVQNLSSGMRARVFATNDEIKYLEFENGNDFKLMHRESNGEVSLISIDHLFQ